jgi:DNA-binding beta-propeller fold protein YncE
MTMIRLFGKLSVLLYLAFALASCESDPIIAPPHNDTTIVTNDTRAMYVLNEGGFGKSNSSLDVLLINRTVTIIDSTNRQDTIITFDTLYQKDRIADLGDVGNDLKLINGKLYVVLNGSNQIVVVDPSNATEVTRINFPIGSSSNKIANIGGGKALVTQLYGSEVSIIDLTTNTVAGSMAINRSSVDIGVLDNKAFISADSQSILVWDLTSNSLDTIIDVRYAPQQIYVDSLNHQIIVACEGNFADPSSNSYLVYINAMTGAIANTEQVGAGPYAIGRLIAGPTGKLFMLVGGQVKSIDLATRTISQTPISSSKFYYGGAYDAVSGGLYLGDPANFSNAGTIDVYNVSTGALVKSYEAGIAPAHFAFYR